MMNGLDVALLYNEPQLAADHPDAASEAGVLESVEAIEAALLARGHRPRRYGLAGSPEEVIVSVRQLGSADVVFNLFEGSGGVGRGEAEVAGMVEWLGYPITGSPAECLALARHKARTKWLLAGAGLPTAAFLLVEPDTRPDPANLAKLLAAGPVIIKPANEDASLGIGPESIVRDEAGVREQLASIHARYGPALVEQFIVGREFNAAMIAVPEPRMLPLSEIEFRGAGTPGWQIVTYDAKWAEESDACRQTPAVCPARVTPEVLARVQAIALAAFRLVGCRDYARVDLRQDVEGRLFVLEVNSNPDLGPGAGFARSLRVAGIGYDALLDQMVREAYVSRGRNTATR